MKSNAGNTTFLVYWPVSYTHLDVYKRQMYALLTHIYYITVVYVSRSLAADVDRNSLIQIDYGVTVHKLKYGLQTIVILKIHFCIN